MLLAKQKRAPQTEAGGEGKESSEKTREEAVATGLEGGILR